MQKKVVSDVNCWVILCVFMQMPHADAMIICRTSHGLLDNDCKHGVLASLLKT